MGCSNKKKRRASEGDDKLTSAMKIRRLQKGYGSVITEPIFVKVGNSLDDREGDDDSTAARILITSTINKWEIRRMARRA